ncbi:MAG: tRNA preQ1(34) S-adenosylmethionine ribosyltransferase-isomerase QueA [Ignavibacteria bacterium GWF2_33_9]|nr:MAG: tRNA preQ1(34) S-adenosylmethionine ribosyltransferase-isomerase QueA [Ignavibacteria bacterium GWF2_33_9]
MKLQDFEYNVPKNLIAEYPIEPKEAARMMTLNRKTKEMTDKTIGNLLDILEPGDCVVVNETKVFPAKLYGRKEKTDAEIEVLLLRELRKEDRLWDVLVEPARKVRIGNKIYFDDYKFYCEVIDNTTNRGRTVRFSYQGNLFEVIDKIGTMPIPPYLKREAEEKDKEYYQSIFANDKYLSSIGPPSAGLHFSEGFVDKLKAKGVKFAKVNVTIGQAIFDEIEVEDLTKHRMYSEPFEITKENADIVNKALKNKKKIVAIGASAARALESSYMTTQAIKPNRGWTDKFIYPTYDFRIVSHLLTNFHLPRTPSLLLASAFADREFLFKAYNRAIKNHYRFLAFGDSLLIY